MKVGILIIGAIALIAIVVWGTLRFQNEPVTLPKKSIGTVKKDQEIKSASSELDPTPGMKNMDYYSPVFPKKLPAGSRIPRASVELRETAPKDPSKQADKFIFPASVSEAHRIPGGSSSK